MLALTLAARRVENTALGFHERTGDLAGKGIGNLNGRWESMFKAMLVFVPLFVSIGLAGQAWILNRLTQIDEKVANVNQKIAVVEGNRFSSADGLQVWTAISGIREQIAKIPEVIPPKWLVDKVDHIETKVNELIISHAQLSGKRR